MEIPKPWKIKEIPSPDSFQNCATPSTVGTVSFFGRAPFMEQPELVMTFPTVLGAPPSFATTVVNYYDRSIFSK